MSEKEGLYTDGGSCHDYSLLQAHTTLSRQP